MERLVNGRGLPIGWASFVRYRQSPGDRVNGPGAADDPRGWTDMHKTTGFDLSDVLGDACCAPTCEAPAHEDVGIPLCIRHALVVYRHVRQIMVDNPFDIDGPPSARAKSRTAAESFVYYVSVGEHVKIGTTGNVAVRIASYPPGSTLLAVEPGGREVEQTRLRQFAPDLDAGREWFRPSPSLMAHIAALQEVAA